MLSKFGSESWALWAVGSAFLHISMIDSCNALLQIPTRDILLSFEHKRDRPYCILHVMFHETVSRKLLVFTRYVYPYMSNGVPILIFWTSS